MPQTRSSRPLSEDPFLAFRFKIEINGISVGGFSECTGLQLDTEVKDYMEGGENTYVHKLVTRTKQSNITLKRGIIDRELWNWYWDLVQGKLIIVMGQFMYMTHLEPRMFYSMTLKTPFPASGQGQN